MLFQLDLETLRSQPIMPKNLPRHCTGGSSWADKIVRREDFGHNWSKLQVTTGYIYIVRVFQFFFIIVR